MPAALKAVIKHEKLPHHSPSPTRSARAWPFTAGKVSSAPARTSPTLSFASQSISRVNGLTKPADGYAEAVELQRSVMYCCVVTGISVKTLPTQMQNGLTRIRAMHTLVAIACSARR